MIPPGWRLGRRGDALRCTLGAARLSVYRRRGRSGFWIGVELRADVCDVAEAAMLAEAVAGRLAPAESAVVSG